MAIAAAISSNQLGPSRGNRSQFVSERFTLTGSTGIVGDTATYTPKFVRRAVGVVGVPATRSINATTNVITFTAVAALANGVVEGEVYGFAA